MPLTYPLSLADLIGGLPIPAYSCQLGEANEASEDGAGNILTSRRGRPLWQGFLQLPELSELQSRSVGARLALLQRPGASFLFSDPQRQGPAADREGAGFGGGTATVAERINDYQLRLSGAGLDGLTLQAGDLMTISRGTRTYMNEVVGDAVTVTAGDSGPIELLQDLPIAIAPGDAVALYGATLRASLVPGSLKGGERSKGQRVSAYRFEFIEQRSFA